MRERNGERQYAVTFSKTEVEPPDAEFRFSSERQARKYYLQERVKELDAFDSA